MNISKPSHLIASLSISISLSLAALAISTPVAVYAQKANAADATNDTLRPEVAKLLVAAQEKLQAKQFNEALGKIADVDLIANKTPYEIFVMERMRGASALAVKQYAVAAKSFEMVFATGRLNATDRAIYAEAVTGAYYNLKDYKQAAIWAAKAIKEGATQSQTRQILIQSLFLADDFVTAKTEVDAAIAADEKAGKTASEDLLKMLGRIALKQDDMTAYANALEKLVILYPNSGYWADLIGRIATNPAMTDRYMLDLFRLQMALGETLTISQYVFLAQHAIQAGFPIEARQILDKGFAAGVLGNNPDHKKLRAKATKDADDDIKNMARLSAEAEKGTEGPALFNAGLNTFLNGDRDKGIAMMTQGIKRPAIKRLDDAKLRLGVSYALNGERAKAVEILATVAGNEGIKDAARLWSAFAKQPAQSAAPAVALVPATPPTAPAASK